MFLARNKKTHSKCIVKVYDNQAYQEFIYEEDANNRLINSSNILKAIESVHSNEVRWPMNANGLTFRDYSYMVLPYCENGTLMELAMKAYQFSNLRITSETLRFIWKQ